MISVSKQYKQFSVAKQKLEQTNLDFQICRQRTDLQERPENWVWSRLLWQRFILALNILSHWVAQSWWSRWWCWYGIQQSCHILCYKSQWSSSMKHFTLRKVKLTDWLIAQRVWQRGAPIKGQQCWTCRHWCTINRALVTVEHINWIRAEGKGRRGEMRRISWKGKLRVYSILRKAVGS